MFLAISIWVNNLIIPGSHGHPCEPIKGHTELYRGSEAL
ncbi:hypothetical protein MNBD_GAMMA26-541 [hydrothermal vent metagenome]|uniref:Uncharacterized protein n=1 Tax=hydrothermal vent metagenome TaxID=652676 RepID=A0A3B1AX48_9ZZZZ